MKKPLEPPTFDLASLLPDILGEGEISPVRETGEYIHWDKLRHLTALPQSMSPEQYWQRLKFGRITKRYDLPFVDEDNKSFWFCRLDELAEFQHWLDKQAGGVLGSENPAAFGEAQRTEYLINGLIEEAIHSSQLEGAATTRIVARKLLNTKTPKPRTPDEKMIVNNYLAMNFINDNKNENLNMSLILELHRILTIGTLENAADAGRLRQQDDIVVSDNLDGTVLHHPPPAAQLYKRMENLCDFANGKTPAAFLHPAVRAMSLHFMLAFLHPFTDGNGRTARALFYWVMAKNGYWLAAYISISEIMKKSHGQYKRAFLHTESDDNDMTYFLLYHAETIRKAFLRLQEYVKKKTRSFQKTQNWGRRMIQAGELNHRQAALLHYAAEHPGHQFSAAGHQARHSISYSSARADLLGLAEKEFLIQSKIGKQYWYELSADGRTRLLV